MRKHVPPFLALAALFACRPFDYGPAVLGTPERQPLRNGRNLERIMASADGPRLEGRIAVMSDVHLRYDEFKAAIARLNADSALDFVVIAGDVTQYGFAGEYRIFSRLLSGLGAPVLVGVGNHDEQADGRILYELMFGPVDFTFAWRGYAFIFFDDNARSDPESTPRWGWLENALAAAGDSLRIIIVAHAPPFTDQMDSAYGARLLRLYAEHRAALVIGGHTHHYDYGEPYGDGVPYLTSDDLGDRNYTLVTLSGGQVSVERVFF